MITIRGIPQLYYGTELLMDGDGGYHPNVRKDFPGGWIGDKANAFTAEGRTEEQHEIHGYMKKLLDWRKSETLIHSGKLTHYIPQDNIYVYFRHNEGRSIMLILNANDTAKELNTENFRSELTAFRTGRDVVSEKTIDSISTLKLQPWQAIILELK